MSRIEKCRGCEKPFYVSEITTGFGGSSEPEEISCPHCGLSFTERSEGVFTTSKLSSEVEIRWIEENCLSFL